jgi:hypothetical protein
MTTTVCVSPGHHATARLTVNRQGVARTEMLRSSHSTSTGRNPY